VGCDILVAVDSERKWDVIICRALIVVGIGT